MSVIRASACVLLHVAMLHVLHAPGDVAATIRYYYYQGDPGERGPEGPRGAPGVDGRAVSTLLFPAVFIYCHSLCLLCVCMFACVGACVYVGMYRVYRFIVYCIQLYILSVLLIVYPRYSAPLLKSVQTRPSFTRASY